MGEINQNRITFDPSWTLATLKPALRPYGIFLRDSVQAHPVNSSPLTLFMPATVPFIRQGCARLSFPGGRSGYIESKLWLKVFTIPSLVGLVPNLMTSQNWLLDRFFPNIETSNDEYVAIDVDVGLRRMAPFCSPLVEGKLVESRRYQTDKFKPAYIKDKRAPDLRKPIRRQIGERIGGEYTAAEREMLNIQFEMSDQIDVLNRRLEWMGASALSTGTVTIKGEGFPTTVVDFGRDPALTVALSGSDKWPTSLAAGATNTQPSDDIEIWQTLVLQKSGRRLLI
jgi:hypothetical protein